MIKSVKAGLMAAVSIAMVGAGAGSTASAQMSLKTASYMSADEIRAMTSGASAAGVVAAAFTRPIANTKVAIAAAALAIAGAEDEQSKFYAAQKQRRELRNRQIAAWETRERQRVETERLAAEAKARAEAEARANADDQSKAGSRVRGMEACGRDDEAGGRSVEARADEADAG